MKQVRNIVRAALLGLALVSLPGCEKEDEKPRIPYYQFTAADLQWLNFNEGDKWVFETASGKQQSYLIEEVNKDIKRANFSSGGMGFNFADPSIKFYSDEVDVELKRLDSLDYNTLRFRRTLPANASYDYPPAGAGEFRFGGIWRTYMSDIFAGGLLGNLNVSSGQLQSPDIAALEVKGKIYANVIQLNASQSGPLGAGFKYIRVMYYARNEGIIRMVSKSGEVWDRLP